MQWNARGYYAFFKQHDPFKKKRCLVMQKMMPPLLRHELRQYDRNNAVFIAFSDPVYVIHERLNHSAVGRVQDNKRHPHAINLPFRLHLLHLSGIKANINRGHIV